MARIEALAETAASAEIRAVYDYVKSKYGTLLEPVTVIANHPEVFRAYMGFEASFAATQRVETKLKELAMLKIAALIGCPFCLDFGSAKSKLLGITEDQMRALAHHRQSGLFSEAEKLVLDLAEAMTFAPVNVSDSLFALLREHFDTPQLVEITATIAWENYRSRFFHALGVQAQGFSEGQYCVLPEARGAPGH